MDMLLLRINATSLPTGDATSSNCLGTEPGSIDSPRGRLCECIARVEDLLLSVSCLPTMPAKRFGFCINVNTPQFKLTNNPYTCSFVLQLMSNLS